jgi:protein phosphatase
MAGSRDLAIGADAGGAPALAEWLDQAVGLTRRRLAESSGEPGSTTLTAVSIHGTTAAWVHLGDSRAYLIRRGQLTQLTHDHCVAEELVQRGLLAKEDAHFFRGGDALTRFLSPGTGHQPHVGQFELEPGDLVLVCSDGLYRMVSEADILTTSARATSRTAASIELMADQLVAAANDNGGTDNISFALAALPA